MYEKFAAMSAKITAIGRPIYLTYLPNLLMVIAVSIIGLVIFVLRNVLQSAISASIAAGASWAFAREFDPEHDYSAFVGMLPAVVLAEGQLDLWTIGALLLLMRMISRVVGPSAYIGDAITITAIVGFAIFATGGWLIGGIGIIGFVLDARLSNPLPRQYVFAGVMALITLAHIITDGMAGLKTPEILLLSIIAVITASYLFKITCTEQIDITADYGKRYVIDQQRIKISMLLGCLGVFVLSFRGGDEAIQHLLPIWTAMGGVIVYWIGYQIFQQQFSFKPMLKNLVQ